MVRYGFTFPLYFKDLSSLESLTEKSMKIFHEIENKMLDMWVIFTKKEKASFISEEDLQDYEDECEGLKEKEEAIKQQKIERIERIINENLEFFSAHVHIRKFLKINFKERKDVEEILRICFEN